MTGANNGDGTVTIYAITAQFSAVSGGESDPSSLVGITDSLAATTLPANEQFVTLQTSGVGEVFRGVAYVPAAPGAQRLTQTINFPNPGPVTYSSGSTVTLAATATSGWPIAYTLISGPATLAGNVLTITGGGSIVVQADQSGNTEYAAATSVQDTITVDPAPNTVTFTMQAPGSAEYGSTFTVAATGLGTGAITYTSDGVACTNVGATYTMIAGSGTCTVTATQAADSNYQSASASEYVSATPANTTVSVALTSGTDPSTYGQSLTFTATLTSDTGLLKRRNMSRKPLDFSGNVTWSANTGCAASSVSGYPATATCTTTTLAGGSETVTATLAGDANHTGASGSLSQTVNPANQTITCSGIPSSAAYKSSFTASCSATSNLTVTFTAAGSCSVADNGNGTATYTMTSGAGTCTVKANQAGNSNYAVAAQVTESVSAQPASQTINVTVPAPATAANKASFTVVASATSGLPITFSSSGACTNVHGTYTMNGAIGGVCTVSLYAPSSVNYYAAPPVTETTTIAATVAPTVSFTGAQASEPYGTTFTVTASSNETGNQTSTPVISSSTATICSVSDQTPNGTTTTAMVTMLSGTGTCTLKAAWAANNAYKAATAMQKATAAKITPTVSLTGAPASAAKSSTFTVTATSNESGPYAKVPTITVSPTNVCSVGAVTSDGSGGYQATVTMKAATGTCTTKAAWGASDGYDAASTTETTTAD